MSGAELRREVELLVRQVGHWHAPRWSVRAAAGGEASRGDIMYALVQRIADLAADAEGQPRRRVPRLDSDLVLPDQLRVVAADLIAADPSPDALAAAVTGIAAIRRRL